MNKTVKTVALAVGGGLLTLYLWEKVKPAVGSNFDPLPTLTHPNNPTAAGLDNFSIGYLGTYQRPEERRWLDSAADLLGLG